MAYIMQNYKEGFNLLDVALKLYKLLDFENLLKYKVMSLLGSLLDTQGDQDSMENVNKVIFK